MLNSNKPLYEIIRPDTIETINNYVLKGWEPGDFVYAVLTNNLMEAFGRADEDNRHTLFAICDYVYNEVPSLAHGSPEKVAAWLDHVRVECVALIEARIARQNGGRS